MNTWLVIAALLAVLVGAIHSVFGEVLIFRHAPFAADRSQRRRRPFDILWATWHIASVMGWALAALLWKVAAMPEAFPLRGELLISIAIAYAASGLLVLIGTRGRHPGWVGLLAVAGVIGAAW